ncbi:MAG: hypothetical protein COV79_00950 [Parcubacteria group bacterium CG11_big_fil_rev_8_21_14_0_20_41_14]|nr:MAG: hypothetical protein COV79_00950 [Parcubacteria group bacterium CG11_big_fil_rev_8_21_14_0_20_41_14]
MSYRISKVLIHNYRSIKNLGLVIPKEGGPVIICGANNVGKTNFLRAVNLFFNETDFKASNDIPYEIVEATRGAGYKTTISVDFIDSQTKGKVSIKKVFKEELGENIIERTGYKKQSRSKRENLSENDLNKFFNDFRFIFVESSNVNIPALVAQITKTNVLSGLDKLRKKQSKPLDILKNFITESENSLQNIETNISKNFKEFADGVGTFTDGLDTKDWNVKFIFPKYELLREAIGTMVNLVLQDSNQKELEAKGSGIQRILLLSLIKYISENTKKIVIWGIDEPEAFLQPGLQKKVFAIIKNLSNDLEIFLTTHSHHFVDIGELESVFLFNAKYTKQAYRRKKDKEYIKISTVIDKTTGYNKVQKVKDHLGISTNDSWEIMPYNLVVEGDEDKQYISTLLKINGLDEPKILVADGADKFPGYLVFVNLFCEEQSITPKVLSILDFDQKGKATLNSLKTKTYSFNHKVEHVSRFDNKSNITWQYEIEDLIYPEILIRAVNKILHKKGYSQLKVQAIIKKKNQPSFQKDAILPFITAQVKDINQDKGELNFEELGLKKYLCTTTCALLMKEKELEKLNKKYKEIYNYLVGIAQPF